MTSASATASVRRPVLRRAMLVLLGLVVVVAGALAVAPALIPTATVSARIAEQIEQWLGRPVAFSGDPVISLYPRPTVTIEGVVIGDALASETPLLSVERVIGTVALLPLLLGRVEIREFSLLRPRINLRVDAEGHSNWVISGGTVGARLAGAQDETVAAADAAADVTLGRFLIADGTITYRQGDGPISEVTGVSLDISWPSTAGGMTLGGRLNWRGEAVALTALLGQPLELISGRTTPIRFTIDAAPASVSFDGTVSRSDLDFALAGTAALTAPSLRRLLIWAGARIPGDGATPGPTTIAGAASWSWPLLAFSSATMSLDGNAAMGSFSVDFGDRRPFVRGTIAADVIDLTPYAVSLRTGMAPDGTWVGAPIDLPALAVIDTDLRLSADEVRMGATRATDVAASATVAGGRILLSLQEASFYGGRLRATVSGLVDSSSLTLQVSASVAGMAALPALAAVAGVSVLAGTVSGAVEAGAAGDTWSALVAQLEGTVSATIVNGSLRGIDLESAVDDARPTLASLALGTGATEFSRFEGAFHFADGFLVADRFVAEGDGFALAFRGRASLMRPAIEGRGAFSFVRGGAQTAALPFTLGGTWVMPVLLDEPSPGPPEASVAAASPSSP